MIDGVETLTTNAIGSATASGFYNAGSPAVLGAGLDVTYFQDVSQIVFALTPPPATTTDLPTIEQSTAPFVYTSLGTGGSGAGALDLSGGGIGGTSDTFGGNESASSTEGNGKDDKNKDKGKKDEKPGKC